MKNILIYNSGGGLGDSIQLFDLVTSLKTNFKDASLFYLGAHENHFQGSLKEYGIDIPTFEMNLKYFGFRWKHLFLAKKIFNQKSIDKFDLIIDLQSKIRNTLILNRIPSKYFYSSTLNYFFSTNKNNYVSTKNNLNLILSNIGKLIDKEITIQKYDIKKINSKYFEEAKRLLPENKYIGISLTQGNAYRKKSWSLNKFINLAKLIINKGYKPVFFLNDNDKDLIDNIKLEINSALFPELDTNLSCPALITAMATRLEKAVSIDNGIMHMVGLANIPMIVLFGPTNSKKFAPKIENIEILDSKILNNSDDIETISEEDVLKFI
jgi:ADP-heptose:LPS heptosyltransferase